MRYFHNSCGNVVRYTIYTETKVTPGRISSGIRVRIVAVDGTWRRDCLMMDAAVGGAKLTVKQSVEGLELREFFLVLSTTGVAYRRCELVWLNGDQLGARFLGPGDKPIGKSLPTEVIR